MRIPLFCRAAARVAFHVCGNQKIAVVDHILISLGKGGFPVLGLADDMHKIGLPLHQLASRLIGVVPGEGQGDFQKNFRMRFFLLQYHFRRPGIHARGISADKMRDTFDKRPINRIFQPG